jgi:hypothetical protein
MDIKNYLITGNVFKFIDSGVRCIFLAIDKRLGGEEDWEVLVKTEFDEISTINYLEFIGEVESENSARLYGITLDTAIMCIVSKKTLIEQEIVDLFDMSPEDRLLYIKENKISI